MALSSPVLANSGLGLPNSEAPAAAEPRLAVPWGASKPAGTGAT